MGLAVKSPLLRKFLVCRTDAIPALRSAAIHDYVYKYTFTSNATSKETSVGRFRDLDLIAQSIITEHKLDAVHDIGVSSGVTSLDLYRALASTGIPLSFYISDKFAVYGCTQRFPVRIIDSQGSVRELYVCGMLGKQSDVSAKYPMTRFLFWLLADRPIVGPIRWFALFDREVVEHIEKGLIRRIDYDVFTTRMPDSFAYVRCMNVLNLSYFPRVSIETALRNLIESLREGGVLQIGRTHPDGMSHAGFYKKRGSSLELLRQVGNGTELREIIDAFSR